MEIKGYDINRYSTGDSYKLEGKTEKNKYEGPLAEFKKQIDEYYKQETEKNKLFADPKKHIERKYFDPSYKYYKGGSSTQQADGFQNEMMMLKTGNVMGYSIYDYCFEGKSPKIYAQVESEREKVHDRLQMDSQLKQLLISDNIIIPQNKNLIFRCNLYTEKFEVLGVENEQLKQNIEKILNQNGNNYILSRHIVNSINNADSSQMDKEKGELWSFSRTVFRYTGHYLNELVARNGSFYTNNNENIMDKVLEGIKNETAGNTIVERSAAVSIAVEQIKRWSRNGMPRGEQYYEIEYRNGNLLDVNQDKKYGIGQNDWVEELAKKFDVADYKIAGDNTKKNADESNMYMQLNNSNPYNKNIQYPIREIRLTMKDTIDNFFSKNKIELKTGAKLDFIFDSSIGHISVYGIEDARLSERVNTLINSDKEMVNLFLNMSKQKSFSIKA